MVMIFILDVLWVWFILMDGYAFAVVFSSLNARRAYLRIQSLLVFEICSIPFFFRSSVQICSKSLDTEVDKYDLVFAGNYD